MPIWAVIFTLMDGEPTPEWDWRSVVFAVVWIGLGLLAIRKLKI